MEYSFGGRFHISVFGIDELPLGTLHYAAFKQGMEDITAFVGICNSIHTFALLYKRLGINNNKVSALSGLYNRNYTDIRAFHYPFDTLNCLFISNLYININNRLYSRISLIL